MKEHWKCLGVVTIDNHHYYRFYQKNGPGVRLVPVDEFWPKPVGTEG